MVLPSVCALALLMRRGRRQDRLPYRGYSNQKMNRTANCPNLDPPERPEFT